MKTQSIVLNLMLNAISSHIRINLVCSLITVKKCGLHLVSLVVLGGFCVCVGGGGSLLFLLSSSAVRAALHPMSCLHY